MSAYSRIEARLNTGGFVVLDGGTGTELERRGATMDPHAWCGAASIENLRLLEQIHFDYIKAGADVITANTYASSRLMLASGGYGDQFSELNKAAIAAARNACIQSGREDVLVAGSLSHMCPMVNGAAQADAAKRPSRQEMADAFGELASLLNEEGCNLILLEMMYDPDRISLALEAACKTGLPVWAGFSARRGDGDKLLSFEPSAEIHFEDIIQLANDFEIAAAGVMHTPVDLIGSAIEIARRHFDGPLMAYPDSGYFKMPNWQFENIISTKDYGAFAKEWMEQGVQIIGGCCGLSPKHIHVLADAKPTHISR